MQRRFLDCEKHKCRPNWKRTEKRLRSGGANPPPILSAGAAFNLPENKGVDRRPSAFSAKPTKNAHKVLTIMEDNSNKLWRFFTTENHQDDLTRSVNNNLKNFQIWLWNIKLLKLILTKTIKYPCTAINSFLFNKYFDDFYETFFRCIHKCCFICFEEFPNIILKYQIIEWISIKTTKCF